MSVALERDVAIDLVQLKLSTIRGTISEILNQWQIQDANEFISKARTGEIEEAEMDAIALRQLLSDQQKYENLLEEFKK